MPTEKRNSRDIDEWKDNKRKRLREEGKSYVGRNGLEVPAKNFLYVDVCCPKMCYKELIESIQLALFNEFYRTKKNKQVQDLFICSCMSKVPRQVAVCDVNRRQRPNQWAYSLTVGHKKISICQKFLRKLFQLSEKRIRVIQTRILNEDCTMLEKRGKHANRPHRLSERTLELFIEHLHHLPKRDFSVSTKQNSASSDLNKKKLYVLFQQYYLRTTETELKMTYSTYNQLFNDSFDSHVCCPH